MVVERLGEEAMEGCRGKRGADSSAPLAAPLCSVSRLNDFGAKVWGMLDNRKCT
jgi:hypothetical protein